MFFFSKKRPFPPAHKLIAPQPRSSLPSRRSIHTSVVHQRHSSLPFRRSILPRRPASLHRSRTAAPGGARGLALLRNHQGGHGGLPVNFCFPILLFSLRSLVFSFFLSLSKFNGWFHYFTRIACLSIFFFLSALLAKCCSTVVTIPIKF